MTRAQLKAQLNALIRDARPDNDQWSLLFWATVEALENAALERAAKIADDKMANLAGDEIAERILSLRHSQ